jgi:hypothetical protein
LSDGQSVFLSGTYLGHVTNIFSFLLPSDSSGFVDVLLPSDKRMGLHFLQLLLGLTSTVFLESESQGTHYHISLPQI